MNENEFIKESDKTTKRNVNHLKIIMFFRWFLLIVILPVYYAASENVLSKPLIIKIFVLALIYNFSIVLCVAKFCKKSRKFPKLVIYSDILLLCAFSYSLGGIDSHVYILLYFLIFFGEYSKYFSNTLRVSVFAVTIYSISCIYCTYVNGLRLNFWSLFLEDGLLLIAGFCTANINMEIKKYSDMHKKEFRIARTDKLTGLANRHYLEQGLNDEVQYSDNTGLPLSVLIFDLDNFKKFNDAYGHIWGDKLLSFFSDIIKQNIRSTDIPVRYGGEEFITLVRGVDLQTAKAIGDRIRRQLEKQSIFIGEGQDSTRMTVSCGLARYPTDSRNIKEVIDLADKALYHAKGNGKNQVVNYSDVRDIFEPVQIDIDMYMKG